MLPLKSVVGVVEAARRRGHRRYRISEVVQTAIVRDDRAAADGGRTGSHLVSRYRSWPDRRRRRCGHEQWVGGDLECVDRLAGWMIAGDCCLPQKFANIARAAGYIAGNNVMLRKRRKLTELHTPWCTYTDPQIAHVGLHVWGAWAADVPVKTYTVLMHDNDRAIIGGADRGFVKIHLKDGTDEILGATIVASRASELINNITLAMNAGFGLRALAFSLHAYPSEGDAIRVAAEMYVAAHPEKHNKKTRP